MIKDMGNANYMPKSNKGQLSLAITVTSDGLQGVFFINDEIGDVKKIAEGSDERGFYKHLKFEEGVDQIAYCVSYANEGCYLRVLKYIPNRSGDNMEAWIFVPANLIVSSENLYRVIDKVRESIISGELTGYEQELKELFGREYPIRDVCPNVKKSECGGIAYRMMPDGGLKELLGDHLFQSYYYDYEKVLFIDKASTNVINKFEKIEYKGFQEYITVTRKKDSDLKITIDGEPLDENGMMVEKSTSHEVKYSRTHKRILPIEETKVFTDNCELPSEKLKFYYRLDCSCFKYKRKDTEADITKKSYAVWNNKMLGQSEGCDDYIDIPVELVNQAKVSIKFECDKFEKFEDTLRSIPSEGIIWTIELEPVFNDFKFKIRSKYLREKYNDIEFTQKLIDEPKKSPLFGYQIKNDEREYHLRPMFILRISQTQRIILLVVLCLLLMCIGFVIGIYSHKLYIDAQDSNTDNGEEQVEVQPSDTPHVIDSTHIKFVEIINANIDTGVIKLADLGPIGYSEFYEDLNSYKFDALKNRWSEELKNDTICKEKWNNFIKQIEKAQTNKFVPQGGKLKYCTDGKIKMSNYLKEINGDK